MSTNFPSALDTFTNPNGSDSLNAAAVPHAEQHANANDAIEALQAKVGINGSAVATSLDYRISAAETGLAGKIYSSEKGAANGVATLGFDGKVPSSQLPPLDYIPTSEKGAAGGVAGLDEAGKVPAAQLPSYVDDVLEYANLAAFPVTGETGKIYVALDTNKTYRWSGLAYIYITSGAVDSVAGKTGVVTLVKGDVGLGNVTNTADLDKPISSATQAALNGKADTEHTHTGFVSSTDPRLSDARPASDVSAWAKAATKPSYTKTDVGLGSVDNTSDADKPVSTATQAALDTKAPLSHVGATGAAHGVVTTSVAGFMSSADKTKLDGVATNANNYSHPTGDGNLHVPATGTTNSGKVLKAGATAGSLGWGTLAKADVGLGSVDNTADVAKPISTAQQTALDLKAPLNSPALTGTASITANSTDPALKITQTGNGDALWVEDVSGDTTPFVISNSGQVVMGASTPPTINGFQRMFYMGGDAYDMVLQRTSADYSGQFLFLAKSRATAPNSRAIVSNGDAIGQVLFVADDGTSDIAAAQIQAVVNGTPGTNDMPGRLVFSTTGDGGFYPVERMRIDSAGGVGIGATPAAEHSLRISRSITGNTASIGVLSDGQVQSDVTSQGRYFQSYAHTAAAPFSTDIYHYLAEQGTFGAGSTVTNQYGFLVSSALIGATNNYGFHSNIAAGAGRWNFYAAGTAANYFAGSTGIGMSPNSGQAMSVNGTAGASNWVISDQATTVAGTFGFLNGNGPYMQAWGAETANPSLILFGANAGVLQIKAAGLGYGTGAGGTVTQATSKSTAVTLNKPTGQITMHNEALASGASVIFQLTCDKISVGDTLIVSPIWNAINVNNYRVEVVCVGVGVAKIRVTNLSAGSLSDALVINYAIIKGAIA